MDEKKKPETINIIKHVSERLTELKKLYNDVNTRRSEMLIHQLLPNHLRRRAMSHNPKRLPRKYRIAHINQMSKSGLENKSKKRPSRKYRRKPRNLMQEYNRRKQKYVWLETHIWHAKRFKMANLWGYKVPYESTNKRFRASYKAIKNHCMIQDISMYPCIEITGVLNILTEKFSRITSKECGLSLTAKCYLNGTREGRTYIFKRDSYPYGAIAPITFFWRQTEDIRKTIWIFIHPIAYKELLSELIELFEAESEKKSSLARNPKHINTSLEIEILELKDTINRFRLTGPFSTSVITKAFCLADINQDNWLKKYIDENPTFKDIYDQQASIWDNLKTTTSSFEYPSSGILSLVIADPRQNRLSSQKFIHQQPDIFNNGNYLMSVPQSVSYSLLWIKSVRDEIFKTKISNNELNKLRNEKQLVPSVAASFEKSLHPIPIILIQRAGNNSNVDGWDIIVSAGYGLNTWLTLVKYGARCFAGIKENDLVMNEMKIDIFQPDSTMGIKEFERIKSNEMEKYFRKPPNKRVNYRKFKIVSPFSLPLKELTNEWNGCGEKFYVLRNKLILNELDISLQRHNDFNFQKIDSNALIPIFMCNSGEYRMSKNCSYGLICLPKCRDIKRSIELDYTKSKEPILVESPGHDENENARKSLRFSHKKLLKRLRNRRVRSKRKLQAISGKPVKIQISQTKEIIKKYFEEMCELWLPSKSSIRYQCSREVIGYISKSYFRFTDGKVCALGYLTCNGIKSLIKIFRKFNKLKLFLLTRSTNSHNYYKANFHVNNFI